MYWAGHKLKGDVVSDPQSNINYKIIKPPHLPNDGYVLTDDTHAAIIAYPYAYIFRYIGGTYYYINEIFLAAELSNNLCIHHTTIVVNEINHVISICDSECCESDEHTIFIQANGIVTTLMHTFALKYIFTTNAAVFMIYENHIETHNIMSGTIKKYEFDFHQYEKFQLIDDSTLEVKYASGNIILFRIEI